MRTTGIIRRIDDLGRVVIPKEIRRQMRIKDGDALELYTTDEGEIIFKKHSTSSAFVDLAEQLVESMAKTTDFITIITDADAIIAANGIGRHNLYGKRITPAVEKIIGDRCTYHYDKKSNVFADDLNRYPVTTAVPILSEGEVLGAVLCIGDRNAANYDAEYMMARTVANLLAKQVSS